MKTTRTHLRLRTTNFCLFACLVLCIQPCISQPGRLNRQPAVAGQFYPADPAELTSTLATLFTNAVPDNHIGNIIAVIAPHAGYVFSGVVAASSFNQIDTAKRYDNIFVIGSSHYVEFEGASLYSIGDFITPIGTVPVNTELCTKLIKEHDVFVSRLDAYDKEHCIEVELPFLQYRLKKNFRIVPIVLGTGDPDVCKKIADALRPYFTPKNLFVISTDFSHYPSYDDAVRIDKITADAVLTGSPENLIQTYVDNSKKGIANLATSMCGWTSVLTLLDMVEGSKEYKFTKILYRNSGDVAVGDKNKVVGYNSIVVSLRGEENETSFSLTENDKRTLLSIARKTVEQYVKEQTVPDIDTAGFSPALRSNQGAFVTLNKNNNLRGCIGRFQPDVPLYTVIQQMAIASSTQDTRFTPVTSAELGEIEIEISVLTPMRKINSIDDFVLGTEGIYMRKGNQSGTFLPQVAGETGWTKEEFFGHCARDKAGFGWDGWKNAELFVYEAIVFSEKDVGK